MHAFVAEWCGALLLTPSVGVARLLDVSTTLIIGVCPWLVQHSGVEWHSVTGWTGMSGRIDGFNINIILDCHPTTGGGAWYLPRVSLLSSTG